MFQIRYFGNSLKTIIKKIECLIENINIENIEVIIPFGGIAQISEIETLCKKKLNIGKVVIYNSDLNESIEIFDGQTTIIKTVTNLKSEKSCGNVSSSFFTCNLKSYNESLHHNSYLNRKISIDANGDIKNCPNMKQSFGNIKDTTLEEAIAKPGFKKYWNVTKNKIKVCQDCEFRYICTDCRAYIEDPKDIYSKPLK